VIEFDQSRSMEVILALELREGSVYGEGKETTLEYTATMAASLARHILYNGDSVCLLGDGLMPEACVNGAGPDHLYYLLEALARMEAGSAFPLGQVILERAGMIKPYSTLVALTPLMDNTLLQAFDALLQMGVRPVLVWLDGGSFDAENRVVSNPPMMDRLRSRDIALYLIRQGDSLTTAMKEVWHAMA